MKFFRTDGLQNKLILRNIFNWLKVQYNYY